MSNKELEVDLDRTTGFLNLKQSFCWKLCDCMSSFCLFLLFWRFLKILAIYKCFLFKLLIWDANKALNKFRKFFSSRTTFPIVPILTIFEILFWKIFSISKTICDGLLLQSYAVESVYNKFCFLIFTS